MDLKQFIDENRAAFNSDEPGAHLFQKIQEQLPGTIVKKKPVWRQFRWAAMVAGILLASGILYFSFAKKDKSVTGNEQPLAYEQEIKEIGDPVYAKQIYHFKELIGLKQNELKQLEREYPQLYKEFMGDINQLDSSYQALKLHLGQNPNREMLLEAMIQNLQLQSDLLNKQLQIIKEIKQKSIANDPRNKNS